MLAQAAPARVNVPAPENDSVRPQPAKTTFSGPSVSTVSAAPQVIRARSGWTVTVPTLRAFTVSESVRGFAGVGAPLTRLRRVRERAEVAAAQRARAALRRARGRVAARDPARDRVERAERRVAVGRSRSAIADSQYAWSARVPASAKSIVGLRT